MKNVLEWLEKTACQASEKEAFIGEKSVAFGQVKTWAQAIGSVLLNEEGTSPIAVFASRSETTPVLYAGVVYSGRAYAPIDITLPKKRLKLIMNNLNPKVILLDVTSKAWFEECYEEFLDGAIIKIVVVDFEKKTISRICTGEEISQWKLGEETIEQERLNLVRARMLITDPLYVIYTSGSNGAPKGVMTSHLSLITYINAYCEVMGIEKEDRLGNQSPLDYIAAVRDIYIPYKTACSTVIIPKDYFMDPNALFGLLNDKSITCVGWSVSAFTIMSSLGAFKENKLNSLRKISFSGSVMPCSILREWQQHLPEALFVNQYGPTEATASCSYYIVDHIVEDNEVLPIGKSYNNYRIFLLDDDNKMANRGEICIVGPALALGYYNDRERTEKCFTMNPLNQNFQERMYRTGDIGSFDENGMLYFHGRIDRQIKHMGHRVELDEIEYAASLVEGVVESVCLYDKLKEKLILFYTGNVERKELTRKLRETIPGFMVPRKLIELEELPKLPNGKIDLKKMEELKSGY